MERLRAPDEPLSPAPGMGWIKGIAVLVICVMAAMAANIALHDGMNHGVGLDTFLAGRSDPWQAFINQDLVSGLLLSLSWVVFRQQGARVIDTIAWVWLALWWGNIVVAAYILVAVRQSGGDWRLLLLGRRSGGTLRPVWRVPAAVRMLCAFGGGGRRGVRVLWRVRGAFRTDPDAGLRAGFCPCRAGAGAAGRSGGSGAWAVAGGLSG